MTPMSEERLAEIERWRHYRTDPMIPRDSQLAVADLLAEVHRLRELPPDVAAAMENFRSGPARFTNLDAARIICWAADHYRRQP